MPRKSLKIRQEQLRTLGRAFEENAYVELMAHCWTAHSAHCAELGEDEVAHRVREGIAVATHSGYLSFTDTITLVEMVLLYGEEFAETEPWARDIWASRLPPERKLRALAAAETEERIRMIFEDVDA